MYIIVGLGNPTRQYEGTKHNVGFDTIDYLIDEYQIPSSGTGHKALFGKGMIAGQKVIVAKPMTYMNLSGESVRELVNYYKVNPESELIVVYDGEGPVLYAKEIKPAKKPESELVYFN